MADLAAEAIKHNAILKELISRVAKNLQPDVATRRATPEDLIEGHGFYSVKGLIPETVEKLGGIEKTIALIMATPASNDDSQGIVGFNLTSRVATALHAAAVMNHDPLQSPSVIEALPQLTEQALIRITGKMMSAKDQDAAQSRIEALVAARYPVQAEQTAFYQKLFTSDFYRHQFSKYSAGASFDTLTFFEKHGQSWSRADLLKLGTDKVNSQLNGYLRPESYAQDSITQLMQAVQSQVKASFDQMTGDVNASIIKTKTEEALKGALTELQTKLQAETSRTLAQELMLRQVTAVLETRPGEDPRKHPEYLRAAATAQAVKKFSEAQTGRVDIDKSIFAQPAANHPLLAHVASLDASRPYRLAEEIVSHEQGRLFYVGDGAAKQHYLEQVLPADLRAPREWVHMQRQRRHGAIGMGQGDVHKAIMAEVEAELRARRDTFSEKVLELNNWQAAIKFKPNADFSQYTVTIDVPKDAVQVKSVGSPKDALQAAFQAAMTKAGIELGGDPITIPAEKIALAFDKTRFEQAKDPARFEQARIAAFHAQLKEQKIEDPAAFARDYKTAYDAGLAAFRPTKLDDRTAISDAFAASYDELVVALTAGNTIGDKLHLALLESSEPEETISKLLKDAALREAVLGTQDLKAQAASVGPANLGGLKVDSGELSIGHTTLSAKLLAALARKTSLDGVTGPEKAIYDAIASGKPPAEQAQEAQRLIGGVIEAIAKKPGSDPYKALLKRMMDTDANISDKNTSAFESISGMLTNPANFTTVWGIATNTLGNMNVSQAIGLARTLAGNPDALSAMLTRHKGDVAREFLKHANPDQLIAALQKQVAEYEGGAPEYRFDAAGSLLSRALAYGNTDLASKILAAEVDPNKPGLTFGQVLSTGGNEATAMWDARFRFGIESPQDKEYGNVLPMKVQLNAQSFLRENGFTLGYEPAYTRAHFEAAIKAHAEMRTRYPDYETTANQLQAIGKSLYHSAEAGVQQEIVKQLAAISPEYRHSHFRDPALAKAIKEYRTTHGDTITHSLTTEALKKQVGIDALRPAALRYRDDGRFEAIVQQVIAEQNLSSENGRVNVSETAYQAMVTKARSQMQAELAKGGSVRDKLNAAELGGRQSLSYDVSTALFQQNGGWRRRRKDILSEKIPDHRAFEGAATEFQLGRFKGLDFQDGQVLVGGKAIVAGTLNKTPRILEVLKEQGVIKADQITAILAEQTRLKEIGQRKLVGEIAMGDPFNVTAAQLTAGLLQQAKIRAEAATKDLATMSEQPVLLKHYVSDLRQAALGRLSMDNAIVALGDLSREITGLAARNPAYRAKAAEHLATIKTQIDAIQAGQTALTQDQQVAVSGVLSDMQAQFRGTRLDRDVTRFANFTSRYTTGNALEAPPPIREPNPFKALKDANASITFAPDGTITVVPGSLGNTQHRKIQEALEYIASSQLFAGTNVDMSAANFGFDKAKVALVKNNAQTWPDEWINHETGTLKLDRWSQGWKERQHEQSAVDLGHKMTNYLTGRIDESRFDLELARYTTEYAKQNPDALHDRIVRELNWVGQSEGAIRGRQPNPLTAPLIAKLDAAGVIDKATLSQKLTAERDRLSGTHRVQQEAITALDGASGTYDAGSVTLKWNGDTGQIETGGPSLNAAQIGQINLAALHYLHMQQAKGRSYEIPSELDVKSPAAVAAYMQQARLEIPARFPANAAELLAAVKLRSEAYGSNIEDINTTLTALGVPAPVRVQQRPPQQVPWDQLMTEVVNRYPMLDPASMYAKQGGPLHSLWQKMEANAKAADVKAGDATQLQAFMEAQRQAIIAATKPDTDLGKTAVGAMTHGVVSTDQPREREQLIVSLIGWRDLDRAYGPIDLTKAGRVAVSVAADGRHSFTLDGKTSADTARELTAARDALVGQLKSKSDALRSLPNDDLQRIAAGLGPDATVEKLATAVAAKLAEIPNASYGDFLVAQHAAAVAKGETVPTITNEQRALSRFPIGFKIGTDGKPEITNETMQARLRYELISNTHALGNDSNIGLPADHAAVKAVEAAIGDLQAGDDIKATIKNFEAAHAKALKAIADNLKEPKTAQEKLVQQMTQAQIAMIEAIKDRKTPQFQAASARFNKLDGAYHAATEGRDGRSTLPKLGDLNKLPAKLLKIDEATGVVTLDEAAARTFMKETADAYTKHPELARHLGLRDEAKLAVAAEQIKELRTKLAGAGIRPMIELAKGHVDDDTVRTLEADVLAATLQSSKDYTDALQNVMSTLNNGDVGVADKANKSDDAVHLSEWRQVALGFIKEARASGNDKLKEKALALEKVLKEAFGENGEKLMKNGSIDTSIFLASAQSRAAALFGYRGITEALKDDGRIDLGEALDTMTAAINPMTKKLGDDGEALRRKDGTGKTDNLASVKGLKVKDVAGGTDVAPLDTAVTKAKQAAEAAERERLK